MKRLHLVPRFFRWLSHVTFLRSNFRVVASFLYVTTFTVGTRNTALILFRTIKEVKALNLQPGVKRATVQRTNPVRKQPTS